MKWLATFVAGALLMAGGGANAGPPEQLHSRVIVSATLNSTLVFIDAQTLTETQPPLVSRGLGPVRMVVAHDGCGSTGCNEPRLFAANHGAVSGSVGMFDLSGDAVSEAPLSPFPARAGSVGIDAATVALGGGGSTAAVFVTNTTFALGGCGMPAGSVTAFERMNIATGVPAHPWIESLREAGTVNAGAPIPYGVAIAGPHHQAFATTNCGDSLNAIDISGVPSAMAVSSAGAGRGTEPGPDGVLWDPAWDLIYVANIGGSSLGAYSRTGAGTAALVPLAGAHPIDIALADSPAGHRWVVTSNGGDDSVSLIDRDVLAGCSGLCPQAETLRIPTGVPGGAPEGVAYDPDSNRVFVVNKTIGAPSLTVIQLTETSTDVTAAVVSTIPLTALGESVPDVPALIAFDVVVQTRYRVRIKGDPSLRRGSLRRARCSPRTRRLQ